MRIVIDMQGAQSASCTRGIGRYSLSFVQALARNRGEHEIVLALSGLFPDTIEPLRAAFDGLVPRENIRVWYAPGPVRECEPGNEGRRQAAELIREAFLASLNPDVVHVTSLFEGFGDDAVTSIGALLPEMPTSITLYDLIPLRDPDRFLKPNPPLEKWYRRKLDALKNAHLHLAISEASLQDARDALSLSGDRAVNVSTACSHIFRPLALAEAEEEALLSRLGIDGPFILCAGTVEPHKNLSRLFRAYARLPRVPRQAHRLVLVGKADDGQRAALRWMARDAGVADAELTITGHVGDADLVALYNLCTIAVVPSYYEGFGLPALEAMSCGAAVIGSNATSVPEVIGRADALFDPHDETSMCAKLAEALTDDAFRTALKAHGLEQARKFSWDETASRSLRAFETVHRNGTTRARYETDNPLHACIDAVARIDGGVDDAHCLAIADCLARSLPADGQERQLLVDVSELAQRDAKTGCQRVTRSVLLELLKNPPEGFRVEPVFATLDRSGYRYARSFTARLAGRKEAETDDPIDFGPDDVFFGLDYQANIVPAQKDFLLLLKRHGIRLIFLVHDILPVSMPQFFPPGTEPVFRKWIETLACFNGVICVSRATADGLRDWYATHLPDLAPGFAIDWVHNGADIENSLPTQGLPGDARAILECLGKRRTFLTVGTIEPRKGHAQTLAAFEELWAGGGDANLVLVGKAGWAMDAFVKGLRRHPERGKRLFWLEGISDEYLEKVYAACDCLIAASEGEGFGLPLIEAARHRLPVLARDLAVFREVAGEHAAYFRGTAPADLAAAVGNWLRLYAEGRHPKSDGMSWITWAEGTRRMKAILLRHESSGSRASGVGEPLRVTPNGPAAASPRESGVSPGIALPLAIRVEGPFDSSYSLARLNREIALALARQGVAVGLYSTEGTGDFAPDAGFLARHPEVDALWQRGRDAEADAVLRNLYPPRVAGMRGRVRGLAAYNWEESAFPQEWVEDFNHGLDVITVASRFVEKCLVDNGVAVPIEVVGLGADHRIPLEGGTHLPELPGAFRFLHVSSGFPRKGIDVLLEAWARAFDRDDDVALIVKTFPNPHNEVAGLLEAARARHPRLAPVVLIEADLADAALDALYARCHALVAPSRGEGFGLPIAEGMRRGLPVITTAYGGQRDFCTPNTAWLVDYRFVRARSHFNLPDSVWAEPDVEGLAARLRELRAATPAQRLARVERARRLIAQRFTWDCVATRLRRAVDRAAHVSPRSAPRIAWVSTWNTRCGVAAYSRYMVEALPDWEVRVLAPEAAHTEAPDEAWVTRCWRQGWSDPLDRLEDAIRLLQPHGVVIQFNFGFFRLAALARLIEALDAAGIAVIVFLHSTRDVRRERLNLCLADIVPALARAFRICVHGVEDLNRLKAIGLVDNVTLFPHGMHAPADDLPLPRPEPLQGKRIIASYGFLVPHKGITALIRAFHRLVQEHDDLHLLLVNARNPDPASAAEEKACRELVDRLGLGAHVTMVLDFLPDAESLGWLRLADLIVFPYQATGESASGAVRMGFAAGRAVAVTPLAIFDDVADLVAMLPGTAPEQLAEGIAALLADPARLAACVERQRQGALARAWPRLGSRLAGMVRAARQRGLWRGELSALAAHEHRVGPECEAGQAAKV